MEAVPRMPMIWLDLKEAGEFQFSPAVRQFILKNYGENPDNYNDQLKKLEQLRQSAVNVTRDFEGCSTLRKYFGQLHYLQSRVPMGSGQEAAVPISWTEIFSGKTVTHDDICYEQACILYNLGALHSMLGAMDNRVSEEGMKVSCTHFQCSAGAFSYLKDHFSHSFSVDMSHQILNLNINLMLGQAQECLLEKSMLDNRKSFLVARISAQVVDYYREACWTLENSDTASLLGKIQKDWKKLVQMKIYYFAAIAHLHMGKQAEEQQKYGERVHGYSELLSGMSSLQGQPDSVQDALRFTMDVIGGKFNSAKKDNDFIYHESVPALDTLPSVKGAPLVKGLPVNPTDPSVTGPDIFSKLVPMAAHEASSLYSEEKAKLLREVMAKIDSKNETLEQFMDSLCLDPNTVDNLGMYEHIPPVLMERCAALSVRPDTVKSLVQSMQVLSGVFTDVEASLREIRDVLDEDEAGERSLEEAGVKPPPQPPPLAELRRDLEKYLEAHEKASFTNTELHRAMNLHVPHLRLLGGPLDSLRETLPHPQLSEDELASLHCMKRILGKVQEMRDQRSSLEKQLRDLIQQDDITSVLVTTERADMKKLFEEQLKKYDQVKLYIDQNLAAQENILKALTEANVQYAMVRKGLTETEHKWNNTVQMLVSSYEAYEDLMKKSQEGREFYQDLEGKASQLLEKARGTCKAREEERRALLERTSKPEGEVQSGGSHSSLSLRELQKKAPPRPTAPKPPLQKKPSEMDSSSSLEDPELAQINAAILSLGGDVPEELRSMPPDMSFPVVGRVGARPPGPDTFLPGGGAVPSLHWPIAGSAPYAQLPRFPPQPAPPGSLPQPPHTSQPHFPQPSPVPGYAHPQSQPCPPGGAVVVRPSTTTVDSVQTPIPSYAPTLRHAMPPITSTGYMPPPQMGHFPQYPPQARMPPQGYPQPQAPFPLQPPQVQGLPAPPPRPGYPPPHVMSGSHPVPPASQAQVSPYSGQTPMPRATIPPHQPQLPPASGPAQHPLPHGILHSVPPGVLLHQPQQPQLPSVSVPSKPQLPPGVLQPPSMMSPSPSPRMSSSTDDLLSSSPEGLHGGPKAAGHVLLPTKADPQDGQRSRQPAGVRLIEGDPYGAPGRIQRLREDLERFGAEVQALAEPAELDGRWRELQEQQERDVRQLSIAVARCYSMKNRRQDVMPYDCNRVLLSSGKDDYINASTVGELSPYCPHFIATQAPLPGTAADFWLMVYEQKVSVVVMLVSEQELEKQKVPCYFPSERGQQLSHGPIVLTLTTQKATPTHVERMISLQYRDQSLRRTIIHLQFTSWPELGLPDSQSNLIRFIQEVHGHYLHQRPLHTPIVVHCSSGVGRTGAFCLLYAALQELDAGNDIPDLLSLVRKMRQQRKNMLQEKLHLKFCYEAVLMHAEQVLQRHGIPSIPCNRTPNSAVLRVRLVLNTLESQDIVLGGDMPISSIQATIAKLSIRPPSSSPDPPHSLSPSPPMKVSSSSSSLELLASLTPEAFTLDSSSRGKPRINKQSFLQPHNGQGLQRDPSGDDPLSSLDPLWTLNKT
uniref:Tyrosine-protein phosphatase non-receptor type 23 n=1 Tax=Paramormyrops kingsleyae TaxID=1676925 RepID=A0A3B3QIR0_9TELE